jgi:TatD DNase family protein
LTEGRRFIRAALGLHPQLVRERHHELGVMSELLGETKYIGEVGLDFTTQDDREKLLQREVFAKILDKCAQSGDKVLTIHSRRAAAEVVDMVGNAYSGKIILHWYSGSLNVLERALSFGCYISINTSMITSVKGREIVMKIPRDRLLTESDGPFVKMGGRPARPSDMEHVIEGLAGMWGVEKTLASDTVYENFRNMLKKGG